MATIKNYKLNPPKKKGELDKLSMTAYVKEYGTKEQKTAYVKAVKECRKNAERTMDAKDGSYKKGDIYETTDIKPLRAEFLKIFKGDFPQFDKKKKYNKKPDTTMDDLINDIVAEIAE